MAAEAGSALAVHAIGNGAVASVLRAIAADPGLAAEVAVQVGRPMVIDTELIASLAGQSIPVVAQPGFLTAFGHELNLTPVPEPLHSCRSESMLDTGIPLTLSSDYPCGTQPMGGCGGGRGAVGFARPAD